MLTSTHTRHNVLSGMSLLFLLLRPKHENKQNIGLD